MLYRLLTALLFLSAPVFAEELPLDEPVVQVPVPEEKILTFQACKREFSFETRFELSQGKNNLGSITKSSFRLRTNYDLYDVDGNYEALGICRKLSLGSIFTWATEIDIYDKDGGYVGFVDGQVITGAAAKFSIYNAMGDCVGIAYLDLKGASFTVVDPENEQRNLASFKRNYVQSTTDHWDVQVYCPKSIDMRILKMFSAFAVDTQEKFKKDT
ncbi:MAG: hypothetical protein H0X51_01745 [Parachlamydiaceae bacterium]|nr:hypothetical protein [Parachlamydiaceae bacterium]